MLFGMHFVILFEKHAGNTFLTFKKRIVPQIFPPGSKAGMDAFRSFSEIPDETTSFSTAHTSMLCRYNPQELLFPPLPSGRLPSQQIIFVADRNRRKRVIEVGKRVC